MPKADYLKRYRQAILAGDTPDGELTEAAGLLPQDAVTDADVLRKRREAGDKLKEAAGLELEVKALQQKVATVGPDTLVADLGPKLTLAELYGHLEAIRHRGNPTVVSPLKWRINELRGDINRLEAEARVYLRATADWRFDVKALSLRRRVNRLHEDIRRRATGAELARVQGQQREAATGSWWKLAGRDEKQPEVVRRLAAAEKAAQERQARDQAADASDRAEAARLQAELEATERGKLVPENMAWSGDNPPAEPQRDFDLPSAGLAGAIGLAPVAS